MGWDGGWRWGGGGVGGGSLRLWGTTTPSKWRCQGRETVLLLKGARSEVVHHRLEPFPSVTTKWRPHTWGLTNDWPTPKAPPKSHARTPLPPHLHLKPAPAMYGIKIMIQLALASAMRRLTTNSAHLNTSQQCQILWCKRRRLQRQNYSTWCALRCRLEREKKKIKCFI